jgi:hypothetical protein
VSAARRHIAPFRTWRATAGRALGEEIASPLVLEPDFSCHDMWAGLGDGETTRGQRLVLNTQGCPGNASPKPKSGPGAPAPARKEEKNETEVHIWQIADIYSH